MSTITPKNIDEVVIGDDHEIELVATDREGERIDLTGQTVHFVLRRFPGQTALIDVNSTDDPTYVEITESPRGEFTVTLPAVNTAELTHGRWIYTLKRVTGAGKTYTFGQNELWPQRDTDNWGWHDVKLFVTRMMGAGRVIVELTEDQLEECILTAVNEYSKWLPMVEYRIIPAAGSFMVDLTPYGYGRGVIDVQPEAQSYLDSGFGFELPLATILGGGGSSAISYRFGELEETLGYLEMGRRITGQDFDFKWDPPNLYLHNVPTEGTRVMYAIAADHTVQSIPYPDREWINSYAMAEAKMVVGMIRGKYQNVNTPGGGTSLDGSELRSEAASEKQTLIEQLKRKVPDQPFVWG
jgi:hypothetical protein